MVCSCSALFLLPIKFTDFCELTQEQYDREIENSYSRALYVMLNDWQIKQTDLDADVSGKLQIAIELLTASEFLSRYIGLIQKANLLGSYSSPTGESLSKNSKDLDYYLNTKEFLYYEAFSQAEGFISDQVKMSRVLISALPYNHHAIEKSYFDNVFPYYNPKPYWREDV